MKLNDIFIGSQKLLPNENSVLGGYIDLNGELFYKISNYDKMTPFLMSIVSSSDHWMFISSNGGLTAGRKNPDNALFPYYTDDIIHTCETTTGSKTIIHVEKENQKYLWEPFSDNYKNAYNINRHIYKNIPGTKVIYEEINNDLELSFSYSWMSSERFGFVKVSNIVNNSKSKMNINILDGQQNILPYGMYQQFQTEFSTLADGYKKNELIAEQGVGIFSLSSIPSDRAEPSESLKATVVWSCGTSSKKYLLSSRQLNDFRIYGEIDNENDIKAARGAYFINSEFNLNSLHSKRWYIVSEINYDSSDLEKLLSLLGQNQNIEEQIIDDVNLGTQNLVKLVAASDGMQLSNSNLTTSRHFSNVLFNIMRGGIFNDSYKVDREDFTLFVSQTNKNITEKYHQFLIDLPNSFSYQELIVNLKKLDDSEFLKLGYEYLPLSFSRRHGDPSRPWNRFSIEIKDKNNRRTLNYEGNWRDIFQNWEALAISYPNFLESMLVKFLNASTADGYNPYRVTKEGFEWEIPEPDMPWSNIGYWGDHQIIYLLKLLELSSNYNPSRLYEIMDNEIFAYSNVPYKIRSYEELIKDSKNTIDFDHDLNNRIEEEEKALGTDAKFVKGSDGTLYQVNLFEKLLVTLFSKLINFVPEGGIWMNTQRPEWNDANNALVGNGVSMVTLYYTRRYVVYCIELFEKMESSIFHVSQAVIILFKEILRVFETRSNILKREITDVERKYIVDELGISGSRYRQKIYNYGFSSQKKEISVVEVIKFLHITLEFLDHSIKANRKRDGLYHSYNLMSIVDDEKIEISNLYEMLEGQVAVLSSGFLSSTESIELLESLKNSDLYREDQNSYMLYPERTLPLFIEKNIIPKEVFANSKSLKKLSTFKNNILKIDINGIGHFDGEIRNSNILRDRMKMVSKDPESKLSKQDISEVLEIYESVFNHKAFTGRSGTFYKYEGLGSIYWHMVSKLVLAIQETYFKAVANSVEKTELDRLKKFYYDVKEGIGVNKSPDDYGAFPTDPYSHTPSFSGVQQPGLTGQVKEDVITRFSELGVEVTEGFIRFNTSLLNRDEFLTSEESFIFYDVHGEESSIPITPNSLAFTFCQVPVVYKIADENKIIVNENNQQIEIEGLKLDKEISESIFTREGKINRIEVSIKK